MTLTKDIRWEIQALGIRLANAANQQDLLQRQSSRAKSREQNELELKSIVADVRKLLVSIEDAVPLINLAITTSGVKLTTNLPATISPSRLLQASTFLTAADSAYANHNLPSVQIGPTFTLSMYMLFAGHTSRPHDDPTVRETTWKEVIHKARVKLVRVPLADLYALPHESHRQPSTPDQHALPADSRASEFGYQLLFIEDIDDDRVHTVEEDESEPESYDDVALAGLRDVVPIHQISRIFYADTAKILDIGGDGEVNSPVLLLRRDLDAVPPRRMMERHDSGSYYEQDDHDQTVSAQLRRESMLQMPQSPAQADSKPRKNGFPQDLDPEWIALEVYREEVDSDDDDDTTSEQAPSSRTSTKQDKQVTTLTDNMSHLDIKSRQSVNGNMSTNASPRIAQAPIMASAAPVKTSLSSLEMLIRLTALQQFKQSSHLTIEDELLNFFLEDSANTGAGRDAERRQQLRQDARRRVGFDPFDESPVKRRGEEYQAHARATPQSQRSWQDEGSMGHFDGATPSSTSWLAQSVDSPRSNGTPTPAARPVPESIKSTPGSVTRAQGQSASGGRKSASRGPLERLTRSQSERASSPLSSGVLADPS